MSKGILFGKRTIEFPYDPTELTHRLKELISDNAEYSNLSENNLIWVIGKGLIITQSNITQYPQTINIAVFGRSKLTLLMEEKDVITVKQYISGSWEEQLKELL